MRRMGTTLAWSVAVSLAVAALVWRLVPLPDAQGRLATVEVGHGQRLEKMEISVAEAEFFGRARAVRWLAQGGGSRVVVTVVDGSGNRRAVHDPSYCFRGAGWTVIDEHPLSLAHGEAACVRLRREGVELQAVYWFTDGFRAYRSPLMYWWNSTLRRLTLGASGPEPILVLLVPAQDTPVNWRDWLTSWPQWERL